MAKTKANTQQSKDTEKAQETKKRQEPDRSHLNETTNESSPVVGLLGASTMDIPVERHAALLTDARFSHPANAAQKARLVSELQHNYGNAYVQHLLKSQAIQAKLIVNPPDDQYEKEADRVAEEVTTTAAMCQKAAPEEEEEQLQGKTANNQVQEVSPRLEERINAARGSGEVLPDSIRASFEPHFGRDLGEVRVHTDSEADELSRSIDAKAFTTGKDVFFRSGDYQPDPDAGRRLLGHELTHVVQQGAAPSAMRREEDDVSRIPQTWHDSRAIGVQRAGFLKKTGRWLRGIKERVFPPGKETRLKRLEELQGAIDKAKKVAQVGETAIAHPEITERLGEARGYLDKVSGPLGKYLDAVKNANKIYDVIDAMDEWKAQDAYKNPQKYAQDAGKFLKTVGELGSFMPPGPRAYFDWLKKAGNFFENMRKKLWPSERERSKRFWKKYGWEIPGKYPGKGL